jgi:S1-C subfamily serine protease
MDVAPRCVANTVGLVSKTGEQGMEGFGTGSGVVISADGLIMTAGHVITKPGNPLTIRFADGRVFNGVAVGLDHATDTGLAKITDPAPAGGWAFSPIAPDDSAAIGDWVLATGNPGSIVLGRNPPLRIGRVTEHDSSKIGTNCALEPGDSGGPIFDLKGQVVGINSRIMTASTDVPLKEYLSLHVPVSLFTTEWKDLLAGENANPNVQLGRKSTPRAGGRNAALAMKFRQAMTKLLAQKDPEVMKLLIDSQKDGGQMPLTPELMQHLIDKANLSSTTQPTTAPTALAKSPTTAPAASVATPTTAPAALAAAPTTAPSEDAPKQLAKADPTTKPTTAPAEKGIAASMRPAIAAQLKRELLREFPDAKITDAILNRILDRSSMDPTTHHLNLATNEQDLKDMGITPSAIAAKSMLSNRRALEVGKTSIQTLSLLAPALEAAGDCVVEIRGNDGKPALLGTIVDSDGYIVTKASDLPAHAIVVLPDGKAVPARVIGRDTETDLALLKISAHGLTAVHFSDEAPLGEWVSALTADPNEPALGVVSDIARPIPARFEHFAGEQKIVLGVGFAASSTILGQIMPGMPAEAAGLKVGDEVLELNGVAIADAAQFTKEIHKLKTGDTATIKIRRDDKEMEFKPVLGKLKATTQTMQGVGEADQFAGGKLSKRRTSFPMAIQTDAAIWADQCGGPLINLQGEAVGVTIARYDRVCTFAIPADLVQKTVAKLKGT